MSKKHTIKFIQEQFEKEGYTLLTEEYINNKIPLHYTCPEGDHGTITWNDWQQGCRCAECGGSKKLTIDFVKSQFEKEGYTLLSDVYIDSKTLLEYTCSKGHPGSIIWNAWQQGHRCSECANENNKGENNPMFGKDFSGKNNHCFGRTGEKHPMFGKRGAETGRWNPSLTDEDRQDRRLILGYRDWAYAVKERDNFICQVCGDSKGGNLVSHHLNGYRVNSDQRTSLKNGITLCETCHKNFHHQYGYGNNTKEQFSEFLCAQKILLETLGDV